MKQRSIHPLSMKSMIYLVLIAQLCATTLPYCNWLMGCEKELIEVAETEDNETEKEDNVDEKVKKYKTNLNTLYFSNKNLLTCLVDYLCFETNHILEITTPPPERPTFSS